MKTAFSILTVLLFLSAGTAPAAPLTLGACLEKAAAGNYALKVAAHDEQIAEENVNLSRSGYLPRIDFQGGYTAQQAPQSISLDVRTIETQDADFGFFSASLYQTLYDFGRTAARLDRAKAAKDATVFAYTGLKKETFLQVVTAYFGILEAEKLLDTAGEEVAQMTDHQRVAKNLYEQGVVTRNDLLQAEVRLAGSRQRRLEAANHLGNSWLKLNYLTGDKPGFRAKLDREATLEPPPPQEDIQRAIMERSEIRAQEKTVEESEQEIKENRAGYYPELFAKLGIDYVQNNKVREQAIMAATVGLKINLFDGLATTSRYRQAVKNRSRNEDILRQLEAELLLEYQTAANDAGVARERISVTEEAIRQGEENLRINKDRYQEQVGTATEVIDAQTLLTQTRTDYLRAIFDYQVAIARVKRALGQL
jgi:outer membrane protein TolC